MIFLMLNAAECNISFQTIIYPHVDCIISESMSVNVMCDKNVI